MSNRACKALTVPVCHGGWLTLEFPSTSENCSAVHHTGQCYSLKFSLQPFVFFSFYWFSIFAVFLFPLFQKFSFSCSFHMGSVVSQAPGEVCSVRGLSDGSLRRALKDHNMAVGLPAHFKGNKTFPFKGLMSLENSPLSLEPPLASYTLKAFCWAKKTGKKHVKTSHVKGLLFA